MDKSENKIITKRILVWGVVQGVGFRPFIFTCAKNNCVTGYVLNIGGLVEIIAQASKENLKRFISDFTTEKNDAFDIIKCDIKSIMSDIYSDFTIKNSEENENISIIPSDLSICSECKKELYDRNSRRFENPFITCTHCGPRYSIINKTPYDRQNTSMIDFEMCDDCMAEYIDPKNRRFHAQTISCNNCGPYLVFKQNEIEYIKGTALEKAINVINSGGIIAVKGIGGYLFVCSPFIEATVCNLRLLKKREQKPFAVMFNSINSAKEYCIISNEEEALLNSKEKPIVLLTSKTNNAFSRLVAMDSIYCGAFLPYSPLQALLVDKCGPLVMTSANTSNKPIIKDDAEIINENNPFLNGVLYNEREIIRSIDDSVIKVIDNERQIIRRSRGYVPYPIFQSHTDKQIFAAGGDLKASFCLYRQNEAVLSQYFGDLEDSDVFNLYKHSYNDLISLYKFSPNLAVCDLHPNYFSSKFANSLDIPKLYVQHHHAHIASVLAEHNLNKNIIGVCFDGTGFGLDGCIWGGEFFIFDGFDFIRAGHLEYTPMLGGDLSMKDAYKTLCCYLLHNNLNEFSSDDRIDIISAAIKNGINTIENSSMGRLFDAVSALLGIKDKNDFEGQCAILLEKEAYLAKLKNLSLQKLEFDISEKSDNIIISPKPVLEELCILKNYIDKASLSLSFHLAVAQMILKTCEILRSKSGINTVALSGGVFQNSILLQKTILLLRQNNFLVYFNKLVPPNDGGISLGQAYIGRMR